MVSESYKSYVIELLNKYSNLLLRIAYTFVKNTEDAEDIVQNVFLALLEKEYKFPSEGHEKKWLITVTTNKCRNKVKTVWSKKVDYLDTYADESLAYEDKHSDFVIDKVMELPEKYRLVLHMFYYEDFSLQEIADILGLNVSTVGTQLDRAKKQLKRKLGDDYNG